MKVVSPEMGLCSLKCEKCSVTARDLAIIRAMFGVGLPQVLVEQRWIRKKLGAVFPPALPSPLILALLLLDNIRVVRISIKCGP